MGTGSTGPTGWTAFGEWAARVGQYAWFEQQLFELLGHWAAQSPDPDVCILLARHARRRAWHAALWDQLLPTVAGRAATSVVQAPNDAIAELMTEMAPRPSSTAAIEELLAAVYRGMGPALVSTYEDHRATASAVAEAPTLRVLDRVLRDQTADLEEGRLLFDGSSRDHALGTSGSGQELRDRWTSALGKGWPPMQLGSAEARR